MAQIEVPAIAYDTPVWVCNPCGEPTHPPFHQPHHTHTPTNVRSRPYGRAVLSPSGPPRPAASAATKKKKYSRYIQKLPKSARGVKAGSDVNKIADSVTGALSQPQTEWVALLPSAATPTGWHPLSSSGAVR